MPAGGRLDDLGLVLHQDVPTGRLERRRLRQVHARRRPAALEGLQQRTDELPGGEATRLRPWAGRRRSRARGTGWPAGARPRTAARPGARWPGTGPRARWARRPRPGTSRPAAVIISRLRSSAASETAASSASRDSSEVSRAAVLARIVPIPSSRLSCSARWLSLTAVSAFTRVRSSRASRATTWNFVRPEGRTGPRWTPASTSRTARARTGMMPSLSMSRVRRWRVAVRVEPDWRWPRRAKGSSSSGTPGTQAVAVWHHAPVTWDRRRGRHGRGQALVGLRPCGPSGRDDPGAASSTAGWLSVDPSHTTNVDAGPILARVPPDRGLAAEPDSES